jgi:hypothetical protein
MKIDDLKKIVDHILTSRLIRRTIFITTVDLKTIRSIIEPLDIHEVEIVVDNEYCETRPEKFIEKRLKDICEEYTNRRVEPSVLVITDAVLLARYSISLSVLFRKAITPRSIVLLCLPKAPEVSIQNNYLHGVEQDYNLPMNRLVMQISEPDCIIEE